MKYLRCFHFVYIISVSTFTFSQNVISATIKDFDSSLDLEFVSVYNKNTKNFIETNSKGNFSLEFKLITDTIEISYLGYEKKSIAINQISAIIYLKRLEIKSELVEIIGFKESYQINREKRILKFITNDTFVFSLNKVSVGLETKYNIEVFNEFGISQKVIPLDGYDKKIDILSNCMRKTYLKIDTVCIRFEFNNSQFQLIEKLSLDKYNHIFGNCVSYFDKKLVYQMSKFKGLEKRYFLVNANKNTSIIFKEIILEDRLKLYNYDLGKIEYGKNISTMDITDGGQNRLIRNKQADSHFLESVFHTNHKNNYIFPLDSGFVIFNYDEKSIELFKNDGLLIKAIKGVEILSNDEFKNIIIHDKIKSEFYTVKKIKTEYKICSIDIFTGNVKDCTSLNVSFFDLIEIINGNVFILGRKNNVEFNKLYYKSIN